MSSNAIDGRSSTVPLDGGCRPPSNLATFCRTLIGLAIKRKTRRARARTPWYILSRVPRGDRPVAWPHESNEINSDERPRRRRGQKLVSATSERTDRRRRRRLRVLVVAVVRIDRPRRRLLDLKRSGARSRSNPTAYISIVRVYRLGCAYLTRMYRYRLKKDTCRKEGASSLPPRRLSKHTLKI